MLHDILDQLHRIELRRSPSFYCSLCLSFMIFSIIHQLVNSSLHILFLVPFV
ncbi:hypothetical protein ACOSP7_017023 [Xanthoceras sorbifolium]